VAAAYVEPTVNPLKLCHPIATHALRLLAAALLGGVLAACAGAPVQEMSDARQAVSVADQLQAAKAAPTEMATAHQYLEKAQSALDAGDYRAAREAALLARQAAVKALDISQQQQQTGGHGPG